MLTFGLHCRFYYKSDEAHALLLSGEDPLSSVSYLKDTWQHSPAGTPVVTASDASGITVYILLKNFLVDLHGPIPTLVPAKPAPGPHAFFVNITFAIVLTEIIKGAAGALGASLFQKLKETIGIDLGGPPILAQVKLFAVTMASTCNLHPQPPSGDVGEGFSCA
jgi:hypothetical protein